MTELNADQREVLLALGSCCDDYRPYVRTVAADCALPVEQVRQIIRQFDALGWVTYGWVGDPDRGTMGGSSWWLTEQGLAARESLERKAA